MSDRVYENLPPLDPDKEYQITELAKYIRKAMKGIDTREAMALALEKVYNDASKDGNANMEVELARGIYNTLNDRLNASDDRIEGVVAEMLIKGEVSVHDINKNLGKLDETYMSDEFLQQMAGNTPIHSVPAEESLTTEYFAKKSVTPEKTSFISSPSSNLYNKNNIESGYYIGNGGEVIEHEDYTTSNYIEAEAGKPYAFKHVNVVAFYDDNKEYIVRHPIQEGQLEELILTMPARTRYIRLCVRRAYLNSAQANKGDKVIPYEEFYYQLDEGVRANVDKFELKDGIIEPEHTTFIKISTNLYNKDDVEGGFYIGKEGSIVEHEDYTTSNYIEAEAGKPYAFKHVNVVAFYDDNKEYIVRHPIREGELEQLNLTMPARTAYVRLGVRRRYLDSAQANRGNKVLPYEKYYRKLDDSITANCGIDGDGDGIERRELVARYIKDTFDSEKMEDRSSHGTDPIRDYDLEDWYRRYDDLVDEFPDYVQKKLLGNDDHGDPIYKYDFIPEGTPTYHDGSVQDGVNKYFRVFITTGTHGGEIQAIHSATLMFEQLCKNWRDSDILEELRWNVHFTIIPCVCPYGVRNNQRKTANGVDISRNFPLAWDQGDPDPDSQTYRGPEPLSEVETQYVYDVYLDNRDNWDFVTDFHNFYSNEWSNFIWIGGTSTFVRRMGLKFVRKMGNKWKREYEFLPQDDKTGVGYSDIQWSGIYRVAAADRIPSSLTEVCVLFSHEPVEREHSAITNTASVETIVNWMYFVYRNITEQE